MKLVSALMVLPLVANAATFIGCSASQQSDLNTASSIAQRYAGESYNYIRSHTSATSRYTTWFGQYDSGRHAMVVSKFQSISASNFAAFTYDCSTCTRPGVYGYVYPDQFGRIYLCEVFWRAPMTGTDSKGGTLLHYASQFNANGGTRDYAYGQPACRNLANTNPALAVNNADSFQYFAENTPPLS